MRSIPYSDLVLAPVNVRLGRFVAALNREIFAAFNEVRQKNNYGPFDPDLQVDVKKGSDHNNLAYCQVDVKLSSATQRWSISKGFLIHVDSNHLENCLSNNGRQLSPDFTAKRFGEVVRFKIPLMENSIVGDSDGKAQLINWLFNKKDNENQ